MVTGKKYVETCRHGRIWLGKRADNQMWYVKVTLPNGNRRERSTRTASKRDAIKEAELIECQLLNRKYGVADGSIDLDRLFDRFLEAKRGRLKPKSVERIDDSIVCFRRWLASTHIEIKRTKELTPDVVREYQSFRLAQGKSPRTCNNDIANLHTVFCWARREKLIDSSPADYSRGGNVDRYKIPHVDKDVYSESEYAALVAAAETRGDILIRDMIIVAAGTGMRFEEIAHLTPSCIRWQNDFPEIEIRASNDWSPKDPLEVKQVPMMPKVREVIKRRCDESHSPQSYLFHNQNGQKVSNWKCRARLQRLFPQAVISPERTLHWHSFRNYFIIRCLRMGLLPNEIMPYTGHDSASMIFHYARALNPSDKQAAARKLCESEQKAGEKQGKDFSETAKNNQNIEFSI